MQKRNLSTMFLEPHGIQYRDINSKQCNQMSDL